MEPVVFALASNERYFPGLYCAVASALSHLDTAREADVRVLDGGISETSRRRLWDLMGSFARTIRLQFVPVDESIFRGATLGPGRSHMAYCRVLLPRLLDVPGLIYLDSDVLVFRDLSELFDLALPADKLLAAARDSETQTLGEDSRTLVSAMKLSPDGRYFSSGVMLLNLEQLRRHNFTEHSIEFLKSWRGQYRFWDQSAINFLLHGRIAELPEHWNRASWRFDQQHDNHLECVLHYTTSAPWLGGRPGPAQQLFERFAVELGLPLNRQSLDFKRSVRRSFWRNTLAPLRALAFPLASLFYRVMGNKEKSAAYKKIGHYWFDHIRNAAVRRRLYRQRGKEIRRMKFDVRTSAFAS
jgi:lipopolysaccharide biosynthesis glycosyltransferase